MAKKAKKAKKAKSAVRKTAKKRVVYRVKSSVTDWAKPPKKRK
ncbi:hypothetical protein CSIRO_2786 [Bradyrhizobiaceae bacterium SG-6C]|nr:hypothetical protein CSIRO_2786 [Bradyrhizobiaceae bacterium SG-6C]